MQDAQAGVASDTPEATQPIEPMTRPTESKPIATLLGSISYENVADYERFLNSLTLEHALLVLISAANYAQSKGIFNLNEAELIAKAIKRLSLQPDPTQPPATKAE
jgi:hypothetical protein